MSSFSSKEIEDEDAKIAELWINTGLNIEEVVDRYASDKYKKYYYGEQERIKRLWEEQGIRE